MANPKLDRADTLSKEKERLMLVLTRRIGEEIVISGDIRVSVIEVSGKRVRLGIKAPVSVQVLRKELLAGCAENPSDPRAERSTLRQATPSGSRSSV